MSTQAKAIVASSWAAISAAGESGTCWLQQKPDKGQVVINHSESGSGSLNIDDSYFMPDSKNKITPITADSATDIFYARCSKTGESASLVVDVN